MSSIYNPQIEKVVQKIEHSLDEDMSVDELASIAGYSRSRFQELFKGYTGEYVGNYIKRVRIEHSAFMLKYQYKKVIDAAMRAGFNSNGSFNRAFKSYYDISPMEFKQRFQNFNNNLETPDYEIIKIKDFKVFFIRAYGNFDKSSYDALNQANTLFQNIIDHETKYITMCHGEPTICKNFNKLRYDACILYDESKHCHIKNIPTQTIRGGTYAKFTYKGSFDDFENFFYQIFNTFFHNKNYQIALKPAFKIHYKTFDDLLQGNNHADLFIPIDL